MAFPLPFTIEPAPKQRLLYKAPLQERTSPPHTLSKSLSAALKRPRKMMIMVQAGRAVDAVIAQLKPLLEPGDLIIDGGNSFFPDTERRSIELEAEGCAIWAQAFQVGRKARCGGQA